MIQQPTGGYIPTAMFEKEQLYDNEKILIVPAAVKAMQGTVVDYLTRLMLGNTKEKAFEIPLIGSSYVSEKRKANSLLKRINGLDDESIRCACHLSGYDVAYRRSPSCFVDIDDRIITNELISNIRKMVIRSCSFLKNNGPVMLSGFTTDGGYNLIIKTGDGDFITKDTIWDFKVSTNNLTSGQTLQIAVYYILGLHSTNPFFQEIKYLGIYNPCLNIAYRINVLDIPDETYAAICRHVIGYNTPDDERNWRQSNGTNIKLLSQIVKERRDNAYKDTGFRPNNYTDGIFDISIDDYWSYLRTINGISFDKPLFKNTKSIKFLKHSGFIMFVSVSGNNTYGILKGGQYRNLDFPLQYYFDRMAEYGNIIINQFSDYWDCLEKSSKLIQQIEPSIEDVKKHNYGDYKKTCIEQNQNCLPFESWYKINKSTLKFDGKIHGCIIDFDYSNHIYINPTNGEIIPYTAPSMYEKYVYQNIASLISSKRPEMLEGYKQVVNSQQFSSLLIQNNNSTSQYSLIKVNSEIVQRIVDDTALIEEEKEEINSNTELNTNTEMYKISNRIYELQSIHDNHLITIWYDNILPHNTIN